MAGDPHSPAVLPVCIRKACMPVVAVLWYTLIAMLRQRYIIATGLLRLSFSPYILTVLGTEIVPLTPQ